MQAEYKEFLALGHGDIFDLDVTRACALDRFGHPTQPPWTHHDTDLSDYFNYGMDLESWRYYKACVDAYKCGSCSYVRACRPCLACQAEKGARKCMQVLQVFR